MKQNDKMFFFGLTLIIAGSVLSLFGVYFLGFEVVVISFILEEI